MEFIQKLKRYFCFNWSYGPYIKHNNKFVSLKEDDVTEIGINRAIELIEKNISQRKEIKIGIHPESKKKLSEKKELKIGLTTFLIIKKTIQFPKSLMKKS